MKRCVKCIVPAHTPGVLLDSHGVCNVCREWEGIAPVLTDYDQLKNNFLEKIERVRGTYAYDALVGLSGGKDGAYLVNKLTKEYGLRVLAVTGDYSFMPNQFAKDNVKRVIAKLGVDHMYVTFPRELVRKIFHNYLMKFTNIVPCHMCTSVLGFIGLTKAAIDHQAPLIMWGADAGQMYSKVHLTHAKKRVMSNIGPYDAATMHGLMEKVITYMRHEFTSLGISPEEQKMFIPDSPFLRDTDCVPEHLYYFLFHPYDEEAIKQTNQREIGWVRPANDDIKNHFDCDLKKAIGASIDTVGLGGRLDFELSVDIRLGTLSREEALARLVRENKHEGHAERPYQLFEDWFGIPNAVFEKKVKRLARIAPWFSLLVRLLSRIFGAKRVQRLVFLIRPH